MHKYLIFVKATITIAGRGADQAVKQADEKKLCTIL